MLSITTISTSRSASTTMPPSVIMHTLLKRATRATTVTTESLGHSCAVSGSAISPSSRRLSTTTSGGGSRYTHNYLRSRVLKKIISKIYPFPTCQAHQQYNYYIMKQQRQWFASRSGSGSSKDDSASSTVNKPEKPSSTSTPPTPTKAKTEAKEPVFSTSATGDPDFTPKPDLGGDHEDLRKKVRQKAEAEGYIFKSKKPRRDVSLERNFITPVRAMSDFLLKASDLEGLRKTMRRSPHPDEPPITVYWRKDVEAKAAEVWGNLNDMLAERMKREAETHEYNEAVFNVKKILKKYRQHTKEEIQRQHSRKIEAKTKSDKDSETHHVLGSLTQGSGKIVLTAISINGSNFIIKLIAWTLTGSHSLFAESIHSLADTINQCILAYGIHKSSQKASVEHPYGYANMRHVASLISGVGIFCIGAGLSIYHGIHGLIYQEEVQSLYWAFIILAGSFISESATLFLAVNSVRKRAKATNISFKDFILRGVDPSMNVVILEDTAAVSGVAVAATCMALTIHYGTPIPDAIGSLIIGGLLGGVASFIIYSNSAALVGRSIPRENLDRINAALECDVMIRAIHDVKGIDMGNTQVRYKAEVDFDGRELTRAYLEKLDLQKMLEEVKALQTTEEFENYLLHHGENIVDTLGAEIDRIETKLKKDYPEVRHCDLEIL